MSSDQHLSVLPESSEPNHPGGGAIDSIWAPSPPMSDAMAQTGREGRKSLPLESIFIAAPPAPAAAPGHPSVAAAAESSISADTLHPPDTESKRLLIALSGGQTIALETLLVLEITRFPDPDHFDSGPLATTVQIDGRNLIFSALDSLLGLPTRQPDTNAPIAIVGDQHKEAALMLDQILGIVDAEENEISGHEFIYPHQKGWLARKDGGRAAIIDLGQILDRVLFETNRGAK